MVTGEKVEDWLEKVSGVSLNGQEYSVSNSSYDMNRKYRVIPMDHTIYISIADHSNDKNTIVISAAGYDDLIIILNGRGKQVTEKKATLTTELPEMIVNTEIPVINADPIEEEKPVVSEEISRKDFELSEKEVSGEEIKEEDSKESTEDAEDVENSGDAEEAETENETETAAESEPNTEDAAEENVLEEAAEL